MPSRVLADVVAYVSVVLNDDVDASAVFIGKLKALGAKASTRLSADVTHVVWRGDREALERALLRARLMRARDSIDVIAVTPLWIIACERARARVDHETFIARANALGATASKFSLPRARRTPAKSATKRARAIESVDLQRYDSANRLEIERASGEVMEDLARAEDAGERRAKRRKWTVDATGVGELESKRGVSSNDAGAITERKSYAVAAAAATANA